MLTKKAQKAPYNFYYINQTISANIIDNNKLISNSIFFDVNKMLTKKAPYKCKI
jgi:hypothetical protein